MADTDKKLGAEIAQILVAKGIETPMRLNMEFEFSHNKQDYIENQMFNILSALGLDLNDDSLCDTPKRVSKMYCQEVFEGLDYKNFPKCTAIANKMQYDEVVCTRNVVLRSCCEHHMQPIYGKIHIAYIPDKLVVGLSKFERVAAFFAARPQVQERLTEQVFAALAHILGTENIAVMVEADHFCMKMRGVKDACADTVTSKMGGVFRTDSNARSEVVAIMTGGKDAR